MLYQLPNGKVVTLTVDEYLNLTDEDIQALMALNFGEYPSSYWYGSCIDTQEAPKRNNNDLYMLSFEEQDEYHNTISGYDIDNIPDEDSDCLDILDLD
jgi:hypothetical protein